jgi:hypothetical protein
MKLFFYKKCDRKRWIFDKKFAKLFQAQNSKWFKPRNGTKLPVLYMVSRSLNDTPRVVRMKIIGDITTS